MRLLRRIWHRLTRYHGETCEDCDRRYDQFLWFAPKELWEALVDGSGAGLLCPRCFDARAQRLDLMLQWWPRIIHRRVGGQWIDEPSVHREREAEEWLT